MNIMDEINMTTLSPVLESVSQNIVQEMRICCNNDGKQLKDISFKKNFRISSFICNLCD